MCPAPDSVLPPDLALKVDPAIPPRRLASLRIAAQWLDCHERTVRRMIRDGELSGFRVASNIKVDLYEIEAFMAQPVSPESVTK